MAIQIGYSPIQQALGLAQQSGEGIRRRQQQAADMDFLNLMSTMQARNDQAYASEISNALEADQSAARNALAQQELEQRNQQLAQQAQEASGREQISRGELALKEQEAQQEAAQRQQQASYVQTHGTPRDQAYFNASGKLPETVIPQNPAALTQRQYDYNHDPELVRIKAEQKQLEDNLDFLRRQYLAKQNEAIAPTAKQQQLTALEQQAAVIQQQIAQRQAAQVERLKAVQQSGSIADLGPSPQATRQIIQAQQQAAPQQPAVTQSASDQQPRIVKYGTDQATGRRVALLANGQVVFVN